MPRYLYPTESDDNWHSITFSRRIECSAFRFRQIPSSPARHSCSLTLQSSSPPHHDCSPFCCQNRIYFYFWICGMWFVTILRFLNIGIDWMAHKLRRKKIESVSIVICSKSNLLFRYVSHLSADSLTPLPAKRISNQSETNKKSVTTKIVQLWMESETVFASLSTSIPCPLVWRRKRREKIWEIN